MVACTGNAADHCCYFGEVCEHLRENTVPGRRWACSLLLKYGTWDAVYESEEYKAVLVKAVSVGLPETFRCGDWPGKGVKCHACGVTG